MSLPYKKLKNHFALPIFGLGTWRMGGDMQRDANNDDARDITAIKQAIDLGLTHIDTAEMYAAGYAEELVGRAIKGYERRTLTIASKVSPENLSYKDVLKALENSLRRLDTSYLDLYYIHKPNHAIPFTETCKALNEAHKSGLIRHIAVANASPDTYDSLQSLLDTPIVANQVHFNLMFREPETAGLLQHAIDRDYFIVGWRPLHFGARNGEAPAWEQGVYPVVDEMVKKYGATPVQVALNWVVGHPNTITLVKSSRLDHLQEIVATRNWSLSLEDVERLSREFPVQEKYSDAVPLS